MSEHALCDEQQFRAGLLLLQSNTVTKKNSGSRNLHRLLTAVLFVSGLLENMAKEPTTTLRQVRPSFPQLKVCECSASGVLGKS